MKILLIGGTGVLSSAVAKVAVEKQIDTYILNRGNKKSKTVKDDHVIMADVRQADETAAVLGDLYFDVVIDFVSFNVQQLETTISLFNNRCNQYIFISSATAYSREDEKQIISEDTPITNDKWLYAWKKAKCEEYLKENNDTFLFHYTVVRPYITYGETRFPWPVNSRINQYTLIYRILNGKPVVVWDDGNAICTLTNTFDFANAIIGLCNNEKAFNEAFHIVSNETYKWVDVLKLYGEKVNRKPVSIFIPANSIEEEFPNIEHELTGDKAHTFIFNNRKILEAVPGLTFSIDFNHGIDETFKYYLAHENQWKPDYVWDARIDTLIQKYTGQKLRYVPYSSNSTFFDFLKYKVNRNDLTSRIYNKITTYKRIILYKIKKYMRFKNR